MASCERVGKKKWSDTNATNLDCRDQPDKILDINLHNRPIISIWSLRGASPRPCHTHSHKRNHFHRSLLMASNPFHVASDKHGVSGDTGSVISRVGLSADAATAPSWEIFCLITGEDRPFSIEIPSNATVSKLKKAIKAEISKFATVEAYSLTLYLVNAPDDKYLVNLRSGTQPALRATNELSVVFTGAPAGGTVHILVQPPDIGK
jgi:hypothetical protein